MAGNNIKGITIEIGADVQPLNKALEGVNKNSKNIQSELKQVERLLKLDPTNVTLLAQKQELLTNAVESTSDKLEILKEAEKQVQEQFEKGEIGEEQYRALQREVIATEQNLEKLKEQMADVDSEAEQFSDRILEIEGGMQYFSREVSEAGRNIERLGEETEDAGEKALDFGDVLSANMISDVAIDLLKNFAGAMAELSKELDSASGKIQASLGLTKEEAEELTEVAQNVWKGAFGENVTEVTDNLAIVRQMLGDMADEELKSILEKAYIIKDVFGAEIPESVRAVKTLMQNFGITAGEAFDIITVGYQNGLNFSDEFIDTINEYSVQFANMGFTVEGAFALLKEGVENGALSLDKIADSMKEFHIRIRDGSEATSQALKDLGIDTEQLTKGLADGSKTSADAMQMVIDKLIQTDDKVLQNQIGTALFGTQWEDTGAQVVLSLGNVENSIGDVAGATEKAGDAAYDNIDSKMTGALRNLQDALTPVSDAFMGFASELMEEVAQAVGYINEGITLLITTLDDAKEKSEELRQTIETNFNNIKATISEKINEAKEAVRIALNAMKDFFKFEWSLPKIKLPHFDIKGKFSLNPPSVPSFGVNWYKSGGIFNSPSIIGVGEAGKEAVLPIEKIDSIIASALQKAGNYNMPVGVTIQNMYVRSDEDIYKVAREIYNLKEQGKRRDGQ